MIGKFDPVLYFRHGSNTLDVCGPIFWDLPRDQNLEIRVEVELFQSGQSVNGNTGGTHFRPPDDEWMIYINTNNLVPGSAFGRARAINVQTGNEARKWESPVTIDRHLLTVLAARELLTDSANNELPDIGAAPPQEEWDELSAREWPPADPDLVAEPQS